MSFKFTELTRTTSQCCGCQIRRQDVVKFFAKLPSMRIGMEACGASHHWARVLRSLGHEVVLIPPQYVKAYVLRGKNDKIDAEAICEAMSRPTVQARFVAIKTAEQQAALRILGGRIIFSRFAKRALDQRIGRDRDNPVIRAGTQRQEGSVFATVAIVDLGHLGESPYRVRSCLPGEPHRLVTLGTASLLSWA
jgi:hypothetical protein